MHAGGPPLVIMKTPVPLGAAAEEALAAACARLPQGRRTPRAEEGGRLGGPSERRWGQPKRAPLAQAKGPEQTHTARPSGSPNPAYTRTVPHQPLPRILLGLAEKSLHKPPKRMSPTLALHPRGRPGEVSSMYNIVIPVCIPFYGWPQNRADPGLRGPRPHVVIGYHLSERHQMGKSAFTG